MKPKDLAGMSRMWFPLCSFLRACRRRLFARETLLCALALSSGSLVVMLNLPVLWRDYDGFGQITAPPGHLTILAFPPLYPFLSRLPVLFVSALSGLAHPHSLEININRPVLLNNLGLVLLVGAQQLALLFALALLVVKCSRRPLVRCVIIVVLLCHPVLFVIAQFVSSEALATILAITLIAAKLTVLDLCLAFHEPYRSVIGRSLIYRFDLIDRMPAEEKAAYLRKLQTSASDPITKQAIPAVLMAKGYWGNSMRVIKDLI